MMKLSIIVILSATLIASNQIAVAQYTPDGEAFILVSPVNIASPSNNTHTPQPLALNFSVKSFLKPEQSKVTYAYSIDGGQNTTLDVQLAPVPLEYIDSNGQTAISIFSYYLITGYKAIPDLRSGPHSITVYARYEFPGSYHNIGLDNRTICFTIDGSLASNNTEENLGRETSAPGIDTSTSSASLVYITEGALTFSVIAIIITAILKFKAKNKQRTQKLECSI